MQESMRTLFFKAMVELTHKDHKQIAKIRRLFWIQAKCDTFEGKFAQLIHSWCASRIESLDQKYFKSRVEYICRQENILRISTSQRGHRNFTMFQFLLSGKY
jgi:hypothetical protein